MSFPERIKSLRIQNRYTQSALSKLIGVKNNTVWRWENDKAKPDSETIVKIASALNTTASYLLGETEDSTPDMHRLATQNTGGNSDIKQSVSTGISDNMITVHDGKTNMTFSFPNNEEGRKSLELFMSRSQVQGNPIFSQSISRDNNSGNNLGVIQD